MNQTQRFLTLLVEDESAPLQTDPECRPAFPAPAWTVVKRRLMQAAARPNHTRVKAIQQQGHSQCEVCNGSGIDPCNDEHCARCNGSGLEPLEN